VDNSQDSPDLVVLTRGQLDILAERVKAGADPQGLAWWISRITSLGSLSVDTIVAAAEDLRQGRGERWYAAADAAEDTRQS
jgi:hypothetical protein